MSIDPKKFGLSDSLVNAVSEALKGGQKKLDKNHNGKLDAQDFKKLRGETSDPVIQKNLDKVNAVASDLKKMSQEPIKPSSTTSLPKATFNIKSPSPSSQSEAAKQAKEGVEVSEATKIPDAHKAAMIKHYGPGRVTASGGMIHHSANGEKNSHNYDPKSPKPIGRHVGTLSVEEEVEVTEAEDAVAKQIAAKKDAMKKQIRQKIAQKQMSVMQQKAQKKLQTIKAGNDKCSCGTTSESKMKCEVHGGKDAKLGKEPIEVNPPLKEASNLPKSVIKKGHEIAKSLIKHKSSVREPYAVGMAAAKKSAGIKD